MSKRVFILFSGCFLFFSTTVAAPRDSIFTDSIYELGEVTVSGSRVINKVDRKLILPTATQVANSTNGYELLKHISLPGILVNTAENSVTSLLGGGVQLRINDITATTQDILSLLPDEVVRVEYIDKPGVRYDDPNLRAVINYVVKRRYTGYVGGVDVNQSFVTGMNNSNAYFKYNHKRSEFSVNYGFSYRGYDHVRQDQQTTYIYPDLSEHNVNYIGYETPFMYTTNDVQLGYSLCEPDKYNLNVRLTYGDQNVPYRGNNQLEQEAGRPDLYLYNKISNLTQYPSIDVYYSLNMKHDQKLEANVVGTYINDNYNYGLKTYLFDTSPGQSTTAAPQSDYSYGTEGNKYSLIGEAIYSRTISKIALSAGAKYTFSRTNNVYTGYTNVNDVLKTNDIYAFAQVAGTLKPIDYVVGVGASRVSTRQGADGYNKVIFRPKLTLSANVAKNVTLSYTGSIAPHAPALSQLSDIRQQSSDLDVYSGNPDLQPYYEFSNMLQGNWNTKAFTFTLYGGYDYYHNPIMSSITHDEQADGSYLFITRPNNQKGFSEIDAAGILNIHAIRDVLEITLYGQYKRFMSHGLDYLHHYNSFHGGGVVDLTLGKWNVYYMFVTAPKDAWGESISCGERASNLSVQYSWKDFKFSLGYYLLGYAQGIVYTGDTNSQFYKSKVSRHFPDNGNNINFTISYHFSHGRKYNAGSRSLNNSDNDSGIKK